MVACVCLCMYFSVHAIAGNRSYSKLDNLVSLSKQKIDYLSKLHIQKADLEKKVAMMRTNSLSVDMLEEQASFILGYNHKSDVIVINN